MACYLEAFHILAYEHTNWMFGNNDLFVFAAEHQIRWNAPSV